MTSKIVSPITTHANRTYSHRTGWGRMWAKCLDADLAFADDWSQADVAYFEHGMEFNPKSKGVNVFLKEKSSWDKLAEKANRFVSFTGDVYSLDVECPDYGARLKSRVKPHSSDAFKALDFDRITEVCRSAKTLKQSDLDRSGLVLGDSHSLSAWRPDYYLSRNDGKTLNGALKEGFSTWIGEFATEGRLAGLRTYFGNIDVRHHLCRIATTRDEQAAATKDLVRRYFEALQQAQNEWGIENVEVVKLLPIENESRKLPKTGYHKGQPFWGTWQERTDVKNLFNECIDRACELVGFTSIEWPEHFTNDAGELDFAYMERPQSVHISPEHYLWEAV